MDAFTFVCLGLLVFFVVTTLHRLRTRRGLPPRTREDVEREWRAS